VRFVDRYRPGLDQYPGDSFGRDPQHVAVLKLIEALRGVIGLPSAVEAVDRNRAGR